MPFMALLKLAHLYFCSLGITDELSYNAYHGEYRASPSQRVVGAGGAGEVQGEHEQQAWPASLFPPAKQTRPANAVQAQVVK
jgi:hypothetical protein